MQTLIYAQVNAKFPQMPMNLILMDLIGPFEITLRDYYTLTMIFIK